MHITGMYKYPVFLALTLSIAGCRDNAVPKPAGYFRIDFPDKQYRTYDTICPFTFEYPVYSTVTYDVGKNSEPCWFNIEFPLYRAKIYLSYKRVNLNLESILNESHDFAYSHSVKADAITEKPWINSENRVFGVLYDIKGNTASSVQFYITDSSRHFLRGALYFSVQPDEDSLAPAISFFREDIVHMIETLKWKNR